MPLIQLTSANNLRLLTGYNTNIEIYNTAQSTQLMTITNGGNVAIGMGTSTPWSRLTVLGSAADPSLTHNATAAVTLGSNGYVLAMGQNSTAAPW